MRHGRASSGLRSAPTAFGLIVGAVLVAAAAMAQSPQPRPPASFQPADPVAGAGPPPTETPPTEAPAAPAWNSPAPGPGFIDAFTRWMKESAAGLNTPLGGTGNDVSNAATAAAKNTADMARGAADAVTGVARDTAGALSKLPSARVAAGRERCPLAPNGAPDCVVAAATLCRAKGFASGSSIDFETAESCPADAALARWRGEKVVCTTENFVTRALCQ